ncbi:hypothetical protein RSPO_c00292 [Ralstonia solanacearum Po82]|uniref:Uncharacterized protein n=1 Tax=Ralstonia solanacearum (strain Po82) TaxID=1031711 RepID=F6G6Q1_RALS8|nr:hypothetical protein RSPO_c00292 [Ralstonia solanacearum Po82]
MGNGSEFAGKALDAWADEADVMLSFNHVFGCPGPTMRWLF